MSITVHDPLDLVDAGPPTSEAAPGTRGSTSPSATPPDLVAPPRARAALAAVGWGLVGLGALVAVWHLASTRTDSLPGPAPTLETFRTLMGEAFVVDGPAGQGIGLHLRDSLLRVLQGFGLAAIVGVPTGFAIGRSRRLLAIANPVIQLLRPVSPLAWYPICLAILVQSEPAAVWVIFLSAVWPTLLNTIAGASSVPGYQHDVARVFRFSRRTELREIVIPHALPAVFTGLRLSMGIAWMVIVAAEMVSASSGIGFYVWQAYNGPGLTHVLSAIVIIGVVGIVLDTVFVALGRLVSPEEVRP